MPSEKFLSVQIDNKTLDMGADTASSIVIDYALEETESWENKQSATAFDITVPATPANSAVFNSFFNASILDMADEYYTNPRPIAIYANGTVPVFVGKAKLLNGSRTDRPEDFTVDGWGSNGDWLIDMQNMTLWDCLNTNTHNFDVATIEDSWVNFDSDENHDFVYAPVRYRQPFGNNGGNLVSSIVPDSVCTIWDLKPALSIYWMIKRAFRQIGYSISSKFIESAYFRKKVMPWTWGSFFDINSQITDIIKFKAAGLQCAKPPQTENDFLFEANEFFPDQSLYHVDHNAYDFSANPANHYVYTDDIYGTLQNGSAGYQLQNFKMPITTQPYGYDNNDDYSFHDNTGTMQWVFNTPTNLAAQIGGNISANFSLSLIVRGTTQANQSLKLFAEVTILDASNNDVTAGHVTYVDPTTGFININNVIPVFSIGANATFGSYVSPTVIDFQCQGLNTGYTVKVRLRYQTTTTNPWTLRIHQAVWINENYIPSQNGQANDAGGFFPQWTLAPSTLELTGLEITIGAPVHFQWYDKFRSYYILDLLRGVIDTWDLSVSTDPINKVVYFEPTYPYMLPTTAGNYQVMPGYFNGNILDWTNKLDTSQKNVLDLFSDGERQIDFQFKQDGSDGGLNIYAARYKGVYLNNVVSRYSQRTNTNGTPNAVVPGAARYMQPDRYQAGATSKTNRFFSAVMHYKHQPWNGSQLIAIIPENVSNTSASTIEESFEPKLAHYKGVEPADGQHFIWAGADTSGAGNEVSLPFMFAVNYNPGGESDPVLTYCNQNINGTLALGLLQCFHINRQAVRRQGKLYHAFMNLNLNDITNWTHREHIKVENELYDIIGINGYKPATDEAVKVDMWKYCPVTQIDIDNSYPSHSSVMTNPALLTQYDLKYAPMLLFTSDLPQ